jgi:uncharacterized membrane protein YfcA
MLLLYSVLVVYILAINFYAVILLKTDRDGKLILAALLGGAVGAYVSMFILKYKLNNMLLMILMPVLSVVNIYLFIVAFRSGLSVLIV